MYGPVVVALDGSAPAEAVILLGAELAKRAQLELHLTQVHELTATLRSLHVADTSCGLAAREEARDHLRALAKTWAARRIPTRAIMLDGDVLPALLNHIESTRATYVVTPTRTAPTLRRVFSEHVDDGLIRFSTAPVVVYTLGMSRLSSPALQRIMVAVDGSGLADQTLDAIKPLATGAEITIVYAVCSGDAISASQNLPLSTAIPKYLREQREYAHDYVSRKAIELREQGLEVRTAVPEGVWAGPTIVRESVRLNADLIAVATHGRTGFARRALGSCAADVLRTASAPVLVVGPGFAGAHATTIDERHGLATGSR
jgi:nucleotide-binding universal stress UspA family protein